MFATQAQIATAKQYGKDVSDMTSREASEVLKLLFMRATVVADREALESGIAPGVMVLYFSDIEPREVVRITSKGKVWTRQRNGVMSYTSPHCLRVVNPQPPTE